jgi:predicted NAD/FAD-binding protein
MRIAIIGTGVSGLVCAHLLHGRHDIALFEADKRPGGHSHTHRIELPDGTYDVDTGFLVYNERTYPLFCRLLDRLGVATQPSDMSFSVSDLGSGVEWRATSPATAFAQRRNAVRPEFLRMLVDIARFNRVTRGLLDDPPPDGLTLADLLASGQWSKGFLDWYLIPLGSSIWSANPSTFMQMPAGTFARFFERHGLLQVRDKPKWRTVSGGSQAYVRAILDPLHHEGRVRLGSPIDKIRREQGRVEIVGPGGMESFDHVIVATHSDQALRMLSDADPTERAVLGAIRYQPNTATLHVDKGLMPRNHRAWASWNYFRPTMDADRATLTYDLRRLQGLATSSPVLVTLNQDDNIDPELVLARMEYAHPVFDVRAVGAQHRHAEINGVRRTSFCGAYWGNGFHEDGVRSAVAVCASLGATL